MQSILKKTNRTDQGSNHEYSHNYASKNNDSRQNISANRLPVNLFHSTSQYSKMLITNGKCLKDKQQTQIDGFYDDLEFINDPLFQSTEQQQIIMKQKIVTQASGRKRANSSTASCSCCCCDNYCHLCSQSGHTNLQNNKKGKKMTTEELKMAVEKVEKKINKNLKKKKNKIISLKYGLQLNQNKNYGDQMMSSQKNEGSSSYLSHKSGNIEKLICKSLIQFEQQKREQKLNKIRQDHQKKERKSLIKQLNDEIRSENRQLSISMSKSRKNVKKSKTKADIRMDYWSSIRVNVAQEIIKTKMEGGANLQGIKQKKIEINCNHKSKLSPQKIQELKNKHQKEAKMKISKQKRAKSKQKKKVISNLKKVREETQKILKDLPKKQFKPSEKMIEQAFTNIV